MEPGTAALVQPESWACCLPSHNTVTTGKEAPKHREQSRARSVLFSTTWVSPQSSTLPERRSDSPARRLCTTLFLGHLCSFETPLYFSLLLLFQYKVLPPASQCFTGSFEDALNILQTSRRLSRCKQPWRPLLHASLPITILILGSTEAFDRTAACLANGQSMWEEVIQATEG